MIGIWIPKRCTLKEKKVIRRLLRDFPLVNDCNIWLPQKCSRHSISYIGRIYNTNIRLKNHTKQDQLMVKSTENSIGITKNLNETLNDLLKFPLIEAIAGRRARRFCLGAEIPDGALAFKSKHKPMPLSEIEQLLVLSTMGGVTGWHFAIMRHARYAPKFSNYCGSPVGRTFPSAAGFITSELFFTDDEGTYFFPTRDFHPEIEIHDGKVDLEEFLAVHKKRIKKLSNKRLYIPNTEPYNVLH